MGTAFGDGVVTFAWGVGAVGRDTGYVLIGGDLGQQFGQHGRVAYVASGDLQVTHDLASLIRTSVLLAAQGWRDHDDADALRHDPAFRIATSSAAGLTPLQGPGLASQPTLSRFTTVMAKPANLKVLREAVLELAGRGMRAGRQGKRLRSVTLDVDSAPIEVHGHQPKAEWNGHYTARIYHPLITSIAETGDMLDARLRAGNIATAEGALDVILDVVERARKGFCDVAIVRAHHGDPATDSMTIRPSIPWRSGHALAPCCGRADVCRLFRQPDGGH